MLLLHGAESTEQPGLILNARFHNLVNHRQNSGQMVLIFGPRFEKSQNMGEYLQVAGISL